MRKSFEPHQIVFLFTVMGFGFAIAHPIGAFAQPKNESEIRIVGASEKDKYYAPWDVNLIKWCKGSVPANVNLEAVGLSASKLKDGVSCVAADFDGNGYLDFVLYGSPGKVVVTNQVYVAPGKVESQKKEIEMGRNLLVLFYAGKNLLRSQTILNSTEVIVFEPGNPDRANYSGTNPALPALIRPGEGDRGWTYFLNPKTGLFEEHGWVAPPGYEMGD